MHEGESSLKNEYALERKDDSQLEQPVEGTFLADLLFGKEDTLQVLDMTFPRAITIYRVEVYNYEEPKEYTLHLFDGKALEAIFGLNEQEKVLEGFVGTTRRKLPLNDKQIEAIKQCSVEADSLYP